MTITGRPKKFKEAVTFAFRMDKYLETALRDYAEDNNVSMGKVIRDALHIHLNVGKQQIKSERFYYNDTNGLLRSRKL